MYTMMGCCKAVGVNVYDWLVYFLNHVHDYDYDLKRDLAELLPGALKAKGFVKEIGESQLPPERLCRGMISFFGCGLVSIKRKIHTGALLLE